jgi:hypothetical protein
VWALVLWIAAPAAAWAGGTTKVFPLSSARALPAGLEGTPEKLTTVLAKLAGGKVEGTSIKGAALAAGCSLDDSSCLEQIARAHRVQEIVFGSIRVGDDQRVFVKVTRFIAGTERRERTFVLTPAAPATLARQLAKVARGMFELPPLAGDEATDEASSRPRRSAALEDDGAGVGGAPSDAPSDEPKDKPVDEPGATPGEVRRGQVTRGTYFLIAGGALTMATGTGLVIAGAALGNDARRAQQQTPDEPERVAAIQRAGRVRTTAGAVLLVAGGLAVAGGVVRAVLQRRPIDGDRAVSLVPIERGAAVVFSGRLP